MKQVIGVLLVFVVTFNSIGALGAATEPNKIKSEITKRGIGKNAQVRITTRDHQQLKGYISDLADTTFAITTKRPSETRTLSYADVVQVRGPGLSTAGKIGIGIGAAAVGTGIAAAVIRAKCGNYCR